MQVTAIIAEWNPLHRAICCPFRLPGSRGPPISWPSSAAILSNAGSPPSAPGSTGPPPPFPAGWIWSSSCRCPMPFPPPSTLRRAPWPVWPPLARWIPSSLAVSAGNWPPCGRSPAALDSPDLPAALAPHLQKGLPFAAARQAAVHSLLGEDAGLLSSPNNILGIEYLRALRRLGSNIQPLTISRRRPPRCRRAGYRFSLGLPAAAAFPYRPGYLLLPTPGHGRTAGAGPAAGALPQLELWERAFLARLRAMTETDYAALPDVTEGLEHRLYRASRTAKTTEELLAEAKTKRYTHARLRRVLLAAMLELPAGLSTVEPPYLRVLGFSRPRGRRS